jgi:hypothetical protein
LPTSVVAWGLVVPMSVFLSNGPIT